MSCTTVKTGIEDDLSLTPSCTCQSRAAERPSTVHREHKHAKLYSVCIMDERKYFPLIPIVVAYTLFQRHGEEILSRSPKCARKSDGTHAAGISAFFCFHSLHTPHMKNRVCTSHRNPATYIQQRVKTRLKPRLGSQVGANCRNGATKTNAGWSLSLSLISTNSPHEAIIHHTRNRTKNFSFLVRELSTDYIHTHTTKTYTNKS